MKKIVQILVQNGKTITDKFYDSVLSKVEADYEKHRPATGLRGLCLIHDNAPAHKCVLVQDFMKEDKVVHLSHPPYSPNLSPCDLILNSLIKKTLSDRSYKSRSALGDATYQVSSGYILKRPNSLPLQNGFRDLKSIFQSTETTSKG